MKGPVIPPMHLVIPSATNRPSKLHFKGKAMTEIRHALLSAKLVLYSMNLYELCGSSVWDTHLSSLVIFKS